MQCFNLLLLYRASDGSNPFYLRLILNFPGEMTNAQKESGKPLMSYQSFLKLIGQPSRASSPLLATLSMLPPAGNIGGYEISSKPTSKELGCGDIEQVCADRFSFVFLPSIAYLVVCKVYISVFIGRVNILLSDVVNQKH